MKNKKFLLIIGILLIISCSEDFKGPMVNDGNPPQPISNIMVENMPGAAKISYTLPDDNDLLYVIATYTSPQGEQKELKSSVFKNYILIEGFSESKEYTVQLKAVDRGENYSPEVTVRINPLEAPIHEVLRTLKVQSTWGGAYISMFNKLEKEYVLFTLIRDSVSGDWTEYDRLYTQSIERDFYVRGFPPEPVDFAFFLRDKWGNESDTLIETLTPLYEVEFDKSLWKDANLPDDTNQPRYSPTYQLWTGTVGDKTYFFQDNRIPGIALPNWITIDLGKEYIFGRFKIHHVNHSNTWIYGSCTPRIFEIWTANTPTTNWSDWNFMGRFESIKPSGLPVGELTAEDRAKNLEGEDYNFPLIEEGYRYMRFVAIETWGFLNYFCALEFTLWGQPVEQVTNMVERIDNK